MDISTISDLTFLKSLAYDEIAKKEQAEANLVAINQRIAEVVSAPAPKSLGVEPTKTADSAPKAKKSTKNSKK